MDQILWEISFVNLSMLSSTIPVYDSTDEEKEEEIETKDLAELGDFLKLPKSK